MPVGVVVFLAGIVVDTQVGLNDRPVLFQVGARLVVKRVGETLAEEERDAREKQREDKRVTGGKREAKTARNVPAYGQMGSSLLPIYTFI